MVSCRVRLGMAVWGLITMGPMLCLGLFSVWTWLCWELASNYEASVLEVVLSGDYAVLRGLGLLLAAAEAWEGPVGLGGLVWCWAPGRRLGKPRVTLSLPTVTSPPCHLLGHQSGPGAAGPIAAQLL